MICYKTVKKFCCDDISLIENYNEATPDGEIKIMAPNIVSRYHKDWKLLEK